jgi:tetratricopeptide (TPR) repeat protein
MSKTPFVLLFFLSVFALSLSCCASAPAAGRAAGGAGSGGTAKLSGKTDTADKETVSPSSVTSGGTILAVPSREELKKNSFDSTVLGYLENGTPESLRSAVSLVNQDTHGMTDRNRVFLAVAAELMKILYPLEAVNWPMPAVPESDPWIGAVRSARLGVYDYNTGNADFLSLVLPSLVLVTGSANAQGFAADAQAALVKAQSLNPRSVLSLRLLAVLASSQGKQSAADSLNKQAWELDSSCYPAGMDWSRALIRGGEGRKALDIATALASRYPASADIRRLAAEAAFATKDWNLADSYVLAVLKAEPDNASFLLMRVRILVERKEYLKANSLLDAFATTNRTARDYLLLRARVTREWTKNPVSASGFLQDAQRLYPDDPEVLLASAEICYQTNQPLNGQKGRDFVNRVLAAEPSNAVALALLARDYIGIKDWPAAVRTGELLVSSDPSAENRAILVRAYLGSGDAARALALSRALYSAGAPSDEVTTLYLDSLIASGDAKTAASIINGRLDAAVPHLKSVLYYYQSRIAPSSDVRLSSLRSSLLADPRNLDSLSAMYGWYMERKDYRMAQYYLKQVLALDPANKKYIELQKSLEDLLAR